MRKPQNEDELAVWERLFVAAVSAADGYDRIEDTAAYTDRAFDEYAKRARAMRERVAQDVEEQTKALTGGIPLR